MIESYYKIYNLYNHYNCYIIFSFLNACSRSNSTSDDFTSRILALGRATIFIALGSKQYVLWKTSAINLLALLRSCAFLKVLEETAIPILGIWFSPVLKKSFMYFASKLLPEATHLNSFFKFIRLDFESIRLSGGPYLLPFSFLRPFFLRKQPSCF